MNKMNKNAIIVLSGAFNFALLVGILLVSFSGDNSEPVAQNQATRVLVAAKDMDVGHALKENDLVWEEWPGDNVPTEAVRQRGNQMSTKKLKGRLKNKVAAGEPVLKSDLLNEGNVIAINMPPGMRAVAIPVSAESMVGGFIGPGDRVDIVLSYRASFDMEEDESPEVREMIEQNLKRHAVETILQNVEVLAVDQRAKNTEEAKIGRTVTVAVNTKDAERLVLARELGNLTLVLRGFGDQDVHEQQWPTVTDARMTRIEDELFAQYKKLKKETGNRSDIVRIYSGRSLVNTATP